jgi:hypothetical protein
MAMGESSQPGVVDASDPDWLPTIYSNSALITQVKPIEGQRDAEARLL